MLKQEIPVQPEATDPYGPHIPYMTPNTSERAVVAPTAPVFEQGGAYTVPPAPPETPVSQGHSPAPQKRGGRAVAIIVLSFVLLAVLGTGTFAGWEFGHSATATRAVTTATAPAKSSVASSTSTASATSIDSVVESVAARLRPTVVEVTGTVSDGSVIGSGVVIDKNGYIVTNNHVVDGVQNIQVVLADGSQQSAQLIGTDPADDLAVLKINPPANLQVAQLGDSSQLQIGQEVLAIGNPLGITQTVTHGIVSALNRTVPESNTVTISNLIQTDAPINPGNSGGALVDLQGNLVGIPTLAAVDQESNTAAEGIGFAIPSNRVKTVVAEIIQNGSVNQ